MDMNERWQPIRAAPDIGGHSREQNEALPSAYVSYLQEHGFPKLQKLHLSIFLGGHATKKDAEDVLKHIENADVLLHELSGWTEKHQDIYNDVSQGNLAPDESGIKAGFGYGDYFNTLMQGLYNSKKGIAFSDAPANDADASVSREELKKWEDLPYEVWEGKWSRVAARQLLVARISRIVAKAGAREERMFQQLCPAIVRASEKDHSRAERTGLSVVMFIGANHKKVAANIKGVHAETSIFSQEQDTERVATFTDEVRELAKQKIPIPNELADSSLTEILLFHELGRKFYDFGVKRSERNSLIKQFTESLSDEERERLHRTCMTGNDEIISRHIADLAREKGISIERET